MKTATEPKRDADADLQAIGKGAYESIAEMVADLDAVDADGEPDEDAREKARMVIDEDPLSVQVRSDWHAPGSAEDDSKPLDFQILLSWGGPATRIIGELDEHGEPTRARLEAQDWGTPWTEYRGAWGDGGRATLLAYASCFFFGE